MKHLLCFVLCFCLIVQPVYALAPSSLFEPDADQLLRDLKTTEKANTAFIQMATDNRLRPKLIVALMHDEELLATFLESDDAWIKLHALLWDCLASYIRSLPDYFVQQPRPALIKRFLIFLLPHPTLQKDVIVMIKEIAPGILLPAIHEILLEKSDPEYIHDWEAEYLKDIEAAPEPTSLPTAIVWREGDFERMNQFQLRNIQENLHVADQLAALLEKYFPEFDDKQWAKSEQFHNSVMMGIPRAGFIEAAIADIFNSAQTALADLNKMIQSLSEVQVTRDIQMDNVSEAILKDIRAQFNACAEKLLESPWFIAWALASNYTYVASGVLIAALVGASLHILGVSTFYVLAASLYVGLALGSNKFSWRQLIIVGSAGTWLMLHRVPSARWILSLAIWPRALRQLLRLQETEARLWVYLTDMTILQGGALKELIFSANHFLPYDGALHADRKARLALLNREPLTLALQDDVKNRILQFFIQVILFENAKISAWNANMAKKMPSTGVVNYLLNSANVLDVPQTYVHALNVVLNPDSLNERKQQAVAFFIAQSQWGSPWAKRILDEISEMPELRNLVQETWQISEPGPNSQLLAGEIHISDPEMLVSFSL